MAGSLSDYGENKVAELIVGKTAFATPTIYIALLTADPGEANSGAGISEVPDANGYARVATAGGDWAAAAGGLTSNANPITFPQASGSWGTVTHFAGMTSPVWGEGVMLWYGDLTVPKPVTALDTLSFAAGELDIAVT